MIASESMTEWVMGGRFPTEAIVSQEGSRDVGAKRLADTTFGGSAAGERVRITPQEIRHETCVVAM